MDNNNDQVEASTPIPKPNPGMYNPAQVQQTRQYNGWLVSDEFYKRCLAVVGHYFVGSIMITVVVLVVALVFGLLAGVYS